MYIFYDYKSDNIGLSVSSAKSPYNISSLKTDYLSDIFKFDDTSGWIRIDFGEDTTIDSIGIASNTEVLKVKGTNDGSYLTFDTIEDITPKDTTYVIFNQMNYRYYEIELSGSDLISIGRFALGNSIKLNDMRPQPVITFDTTDIQYTSNSGQSYGVGGYIFTVVDLSWPELTEDEKDMLWNFKSTVQTFKPFFIEFNCLEQTELFAVLTSKFSLTRADVPGMFTAALTVRQSF